MAQGQHFDATPGLRPAPDNQNLEQEANHDVEKGVEHGREYGTGRDVLGWGQPKSCGPRAEPSIQVLLLAIGVTHWASLDTRWPVIVAAPSVALPTFAALGFIGGAVGGAIASPVEAVLTICRAATAGPAWRCLQALRR